MVFADGGPLQPVENYNDGGLVQPKGPGALGDFLDGSIAGSWSLDISGTGFSTGTLNEFCMQFLVGCAIDRPVIDSCKILNGDGLPPIEITFSGVDSDVAEEIQILRNGVVIATLDATATEYLDDDIPGTGPGTEGDLQENGEERRIIVIRFQPNQGLTIGESRRSLRTAKGGTRE